MLCLILIVRKAKRQAKKSNLWRNLVVKVETEPEFLVAKEEILVTLATVSNSSPAFKDSFLEN